LAVAYRDAATLGKIRIMVMASDVLDRVLVLEMVRVTEAAAIAAATLVGRGDEKAADAAAVEAMRAALNELYMDGTVVIGEGERDEAPMLYIGEKVGSAIGKGPKIDIALDPLEGTTITAKAGPNALAVLAVAEHGNLLNAPDVYMEKLAVGPGYPDGVIDLRKTATENIHAVAAAKGVEPHEIIACVLDRPRHEKLIAELRTIGCGVMLIGDGDVAGVIATTNPDTTIDIYMGSGGGGGGSALRRWAVQGQADLPQRRRAGTGEEVGDHRPRLYLRPDRAGEGRLHLCRDRRYRRFAAGRRQEIEGRHDDDRERRDAGEFGNRPVGSRRASQGLRIGSR
jgi:fructose-1,6-bisphosphatase/sedoheptulose 1,7-bisphosphatase-like protein